MSSPFRPVKKVKHERPETPISRRVSPKLQVSQPTHIENDIDKALASGDYQSIVEYVHEHGLNEQILLTEVKSDQKKISNELATLNRSYSPMYDPEEIYSLAVCKILRLERILELLKASKNTYGPAYAVYMCRMLSFDKSIGPARDDKLMRTIQAMKRLKLKF